MIDRLEKKLGRFAIKNLIYYILGGYLIGYILLLFDSQLGLYEYIIMDPAMVMKGQVWRLFTWILTPPQGLSFFVVFMFLLYFFIGRTLEANLGAFRYNLYIFSGWFFMTLGAMAVYWITNAIYGASGAICMDVSTYYINLASFLAFAVLFPDQLIYFFGIIPIKIKWIAIIDVIYLGINLLSDIIVLLNTQATYQYAEMFGFSGSYVKIYAITQMFSIVISLLNFVIFFLMNRNFKRFGYKETRRRNDFRRSAEAGRREFNNRSARTAAGADMSSKSRQKRAFRPQGSNSVIHRCEVCGRSSIEHPELQFRYCSKCSGNHEYCQDHIFTHQHISEQQSPPAR